MSGPAPTVAKGYRVVPQRLWPAPVESPSSVPGVRPGAGYRYLHIKEHRGIFRVTSGKNHGEAVKAREFAKGTTLFVGNVDDQGVDSSGVACWMYYVTLGERCKCTNFMRCTNFTVLRSLVLFVITLMSAATICNPSSLLRCCTECLLHKCCNF